MFFAVCALVSILVSVLLGFPKKIGLRLQMCFLALIFLLGIFFFIMALTTPGWGGLGYAVMTMTSVFCFVPSLMTVIMITVIKKVRNKKLELQSINKEHMEQL